MVRLSVHRDGIHGDPGGDRIVNHLVRIDPHHSRLRREPDLSVRAFKRRRPVRRALKGRRKPILKVEDFVRDLASSVTLELADFTDGNVNESTLLGEPKAASV